MTSAVPSAPIQPTAPGIAPTAGGDPSAAARLDQALAQQKAILAGLPAGAPANRQALLDSMGVAARSGDIPALDNAINHFLALSLDVSGGKPRLEASVTEAFKTLERQAQVLPGGEALLRRRAFRQLTRMVQDNREVNGRRAPADSQKDLTLRALVNGYQAALSKEAAAQSAKRLVRHVEDVARPPAANDPDLQPIIAAANSATSPDGSSEIRAALSRYLIERHWNGRAPMPGEGVTHEEVSTGFEQVLSVNWGENTDDVLDAATDLVVGWSQYHRLPDGTFPAKGAPGAEANGLIFGYLDALPNYMQDDAIARLKDYHQKVSRPYQPAQPVDLKTAQMLEKVKELAGSTAPEAKAAMVEQMISHLASAMWQDQPPSAGQPIDFAAGREAFGQINAYRGAQQQQVQLAMNEAALHMIIFHYEKTGSKDEIGVPPPSGSIAGDNIKMIKAAFVAQLPMSERADAMNRIDAVLRDLAAAPGRP